VAFSARLVWSALREHSILAAWLCLCRQAPPGYWSLSWRRPLALVPVGLAFVVATIPATGSRAALVAITVGTTLPLTFALLGRLFSGLVACGLLS
jgi:hypothetical protein